MKVVLNKRSGARKNARPATQLETYLRSQLPEATVEALDSAAELDRYISRLADAREGVIVAAGGDGTINAVASALVGTEKTLGVLPLGTFNHFARDLGIPLDLDEAVRVLREGRVMPVDTGQVNGRVFLNNSSIGFYSDLVRNRQERERLYASKRLATLWALCASLWRFRRLELSLSAEGNTLHRRTPFLFVGNNQYQLERVNIGRRACLDAGTLCIFVAHATGPFHLLRLALRAVLGRLHAANDFDSLEATDAVVRTARPRLTVALDGEVVKMEAPLHYRVMPGALRVIVPVVRSTSA